MAKKKEKILPKIVVVDDSEVSRESISVILSEEGFQVLGEASSAEQAMNIYGSTDANIFIIDIVMPERSGLELARVLTDNPTRPIYIIMMSSLVSETMVIESISSGAMDFLAKPFEKADLLKSVRKLTQIMNNNS